MTSTTFDPVRPATVKITRHPLRCIGTYVGASGAVDYPIGWDDADRDTSWVRSYLEALGISKGDFVAVVSTGHEAPWYAPVIDAVNALGATVCPLEPARFELGRALMFLRRFPISTLIALDAELGATLNADVGLRSLFANLRHIVVRPEARELVSDLGCARGVLAPIGPALGLPCLASPLLLHFNEAEWRFEMQGETVRVSSVAARMHAPQNLALGAVGELVLNHHCSCAHGSQAISAVKPSGAK